MSRYNINDSEAQRRKGLQELLKVMKPLELYEKLMSKFEESRINYNLGFQTENTFLEQMNKYRDDAIWVERFIKHKPIHPIEWFGH